MEHQQESLRLKSQLEKAKSELTMFAEITNAMRTTLKLDQVLFIILTAVTAHEGLGFNRAMLFFVKESEKVLEGVMGIGPRTGEEANMIWGEIEAKRMTLEDLINAYSASKKSNLTPFDQMVKTLKVPLSEEGGIIALTALEAIPFEITSHETRDRVSDPILNQLNIDHFVSVPLKARDRVVGVLVADNVITKKPITKDDLRILYMFANQAGLAIENSRLYERSLEMAKQDSLTGLWNHGHFQQFFGNALEHARHREGNLSLILLDIDDFKKFNDAHGHPVGDYILKETARLLLESARKTDFVARYGGEEFAIVLPGVKKDDAWEFAKRLQEKIKNHPFSVNGSGGPVSIAVSGGVSSYPFDGNTKDRLIESADKALYKAKHSGKNLIIMANS
ncbi:MAG: sensor domain-containing diguanylate cyclase [Candidatus Omnitrophica bacterium]|nr:sensor domain-containing diguanylate cyclase [Candidatus Omnitrophota bacterium]